MAEIIFNYNGNKAIIQSNKGEKMKNIIDKFICKAQLDKNLIYFLYSGNNVNEELNFEELANEEDKIRNKMNIIVNDNNISNEISSIKKSKYTICPICKENIKLNLEEYKIYLFECKNKHEIDNILINEFEQTQISDISKIECEKCKGTNKNETYKNAFYRCNTCKINICPMCKSSHDKTHNIINYDNKNYLCEKHNEVYSLYCNKCKMNICMHCENEHNNHEIISFGKIFPNIDEIKVKKEKLREKLDILKNDVKEMINILNITIENLENYFNISDYIINNYDNKQVNYEILYNINNIYNNNLIDDIDYIINENYNNKFKKIFGMHEQMLSKDINKLKIYYKINKNEKKIKIFGKEFVENNKEKCKLFIEGKEYELMEYLDIKNIKEIKDKLEITLVGIRNITNASYMFSGREGILIDEKFESLLSVPDLSKWNTINVTDMKYMFFCCSSLTSLPDISEWNTINVTDMNHMFSYCKSLLSLPDISKWNTSNVINMDFMFCECSSLSSLPDISKWNISKVKSKACMFSDCNKLLEIPSDFK